jgi:hypothetical protein
MWAFLAGFYLGGALVVPAVYIAARNHDAEAIPLAILVMATALWPIPVAIGLSAVFTGRKL